MIEPTRTTDLSPELATGGLLVGQGITRRNLLKATGILVVGFSLFGPQAAQARTAAQTGGAVPPDALDSWLAVAEDGSITLYSGKVDLGTGVETAMAQIAAEELDASLAQITVIMGDTALTVDQGATVGSGSIARGGPQIRQAAAEARQVLLQLASAQLGAPVEQLTVQDGIVSVQGDPTRSVSYGALLHGRHFDLQVSGTATPKSPDAYTIVGQAIARVDIPSKVTGQATYVQDVRRPGMLHGRMVKPSGVGSMLLHVDEGSVGDIPGVQVVVRGNFVGVVAEREEHAIRAAEQLQVTWSDWAGLPAMADTYDVLRKTASVDRVVGETGDAEAGLAGAARTVQASYYFPFQTHGSIGPSCAVADVRNGQATIWSGTQGSHGLRRDLAEVLHLPVEQVRVIWVQGSGSYGSNGADDATVDAAILSQAVGRPVRVQWMREDEHRWSTAGPAMVMDLHGGLDDQGRVAAFDFHTYTPSHFYTDILAEQLLNREPTVPAGPPERAQPWGGDAGRVYAFDGSVRDVLHQLQETPLRSQPLRAPGQVATTFALESFMDELAAAVGTHPVEFRLRHLTNQRAIEVVRAAADHSAWDTSPSLHAAGGAGLAHGRGVALVQRGTTFVAMVADVDVDRTNGRVLVTRIVVAHDCGLIINPDGVRNQVEGNVIQTLSRTLHEELAWDDANVTSVDWRTYPILTFPEVPAIEIVLLNHPDLPASGVGEPASCPVAAVVANAIFDATGVRLREVPFTPSRVLAALGQLS